MFPSTYFAPRYFARRYFGRPPVVVPTTGPSFADLKVIILKTLADSGGVFFTDADISESLQDAYDDITARSQCLLKTATFTFQADLVHYDWTKTPFELDDYIATIAVFNNVTNQWLDDSMSLRDFDKLRDDYENWRGAVRYWASHSTYISTFLPATPTTSGTFILYYWAAAPEIIDSEEPLIALDVLKLLTDYVIGDQLEDAEEFAKASIFFNSYELRLAEYAQRVKQRAKTDLILGV